LLQREIASAYNPKTTTFTGNKYFYKKPKKATLELIDSEEPIIVLTNYNLLDQSFDILGEENTLKLLPNKIVRVAFNDRVFVSKNGKFYQSIEENSDFALLADTFLEAYIPEYQPGIQEKPDPRYRKNNSVFLYYKNRFTYIERRKNFLISMFDKSKTKEINSFYKKNKISPRDDNELKTLFTEFFKFLSL
tara:strand:+ start:3711 stop:4283 length:573 start_codon:yes stop_codon:yes gene_type:complete